MEVHRHVLFLSLTVVPFLFIAARPFPARPALRTVPCQQSLPSCCYHAPLSVILYISYLISILDIDYSNSLLTKNIQCRNGIKCLLMCHPPATNVAMQNVVIGKWWMVHQQTREAIATLDVLSEHPMQ